MKKLLLAACLLVAGAASAFAQKKGDVSLGGGVSFATEGSNFGFGGKARYGITDNIRLDGGITFFLPQTNYGVKSSAMDITANAHYLFPVADALTVYPLAGLSYFHWKNSIDNQEYNALLAAAGLRGGGKLGLNIGGGVSYALNSALSLGAEFKYTLIGGGNIPVLGANVMFTL